MAHVDKNGPSDHAVVIESHTGSRQAHEHYRAGQSISAIVAGVGWSFGVGLEAVSAVWEHADDQERQLPAPPMVFGAAGEGAGAVKIGIIIPKIIGIEFPRSDIRIESR